MKRILTSFVAKHGDLLWLLPSLKALKVQQKAEIDLMVSDYLAPMVPLLKAQPYLSRVWSELTWKINFTAPASPVNPPNGYPLLKEWDWASQSYIGEYDYIQPMSMESWPNPTIIEDHMNRAGVSFDPWQPWLDPLSGHKWDMNGRAFKQPIGICFSDEWCELKAGLILSLLAAFPEQKFQLLTYPESRLAKEFRFPFMNLQTIYTSISGLSDWLVGCKLVVCCKSAPRVMARGLGLKTAVIEPSQPRHNPVFDMPKNDRPDLERILNGFDSRQAVELVGGML